MQAMMMLMMMQYLWLCEINREKMFALVNDELDADEAKKLKEHTEQCTGCKKIYEQLRSIVDGLHELGPEKPDIKPSPGLHERIMSRIRLREAQQVLEEFEDGVSEETVVLLRLLEDIPRQRQRQLAERTRSFRRFSRRCKVRLMSVRKISFSTSWR